MLTFLMVNKRVRDSQANTREANRGGRERHALDFQPVQRCGARFAYSQGAKMGGRVKLVPYGVERDFPLFGETELCRDMQLYVAGQRK